MRRHAASTDRDDLERECPGREAQTPLLIGSEEQWLAVLQVQLRVGRRGFRGEAVEHPVVEDDAVLEHLDERRPFVRMSALQQRHDVGLLRVHRTSDEPRPGAQSERAGRYGVLDRALGCGR